MHSLGGIFKDFQLEEILDISSKTNQISQPATKSPKSNKKTEKCKRSLRKTYSKLSISELIKSNVKENQAKEVGSGNRSTKSSKNCHPSGHGSGNNNHNNHSHKHNHNSNVKPCVKTCVKPCVKSPTKVKSASWKRSEKQIASYNTIGGKKSKSLRKRSPNWLKLPNSTAKIAEKVTYVSIDSTSVCRPGIRYSDVLFGAASSCLMKIKTLTPRRNMNTAQKKLAKALIKCSKSTETEGGSCSETEDDRDIFPSLSEFNKTVGDTGGGGAGMCVGGAGCSLTKRNQLRNSTQLRSGDDEANDAVGEAEDGDDGADVVILSESNGVKNKSNGKFHDITYGSYLESHFRQMNDTDSQQYPSATGKQQLFTVDIPQWNFLDANVGLEAYPKFLCQFEDEHYLKAEKIALLGLKLALGNTIHQGKFKF